MNGYRGLIGGPIRIEVTLSSMLRHESMLSETLVYLILKLPIAAMHWLRDVLAGQIETRGQTLPPIPVEERRQPGGI